MPHCIHFHLHVLFLLRVVGNLKHFCPGMSCSAVNCFLQLQKSIYSATVQASTTNNRNYSSNINFLLLYSLLELQNGQNFNKMVEFKKLM
jgi:hypothetical protein